MAKKHSFILDIDNNYQGYAEADQIIKAASEGTVADAKITRISLAEYINNNIIANKLEEPINGKDMESSFTVVPVEEWKRSPGGYLNDVHFHVRVHSCGKDNNECMANLHYLAVLLSDFGNLIADGRLSVFLVPRTADKFPFIDGEKNTDTDLYTAASMHLRSFIGSGMYGVVYGVAKKYSDADPGIVKALDFHIYPKISDCFPIVSFNGKNIPDDKLINEYFNLPKINSKYNSIREFTEDELNGLDCYSMLFEDTVVRKYLSSARDLRKNGRFGFASSNDPRLALVDYVFETSLNCLKDKLKKNNVDFYNFYDNTMLRDKMDGLSIFTFSIFAFLTEIPSRISDDDFYGLIENDLDLAAEISSALNQIVQNSIQHSEKKICVLSLFKDYEPNMDINGKILKIIVSDLGNKTIIKTFCEKIEAENETAKALGNNAGFDLKSIVSANANLISDSENLKLRFLFGDFGSCKRETLNSWRKFRQSDSSAHIGLTVFSSIMNRCRAKYFVISSADHSRTDSEKYENLPGNAGNSEYVIPGTEFNISIPVRGLPHENSYSFSQLNRGNYSEDYKCRATAFTFMTK